MIQMTYQHFDPPVAEVTIDALAYPTELAKQMLIEGNIPNNFTAVMHLIEALITYRTVVYGRHENWPGHYTTIESVMNYVHKHSITGFYPEEVYWERLNCLAGKLLDHIHFFEGLSNNEVSTDNYS